MLYAQGLNIGRNGEFVAGEERVFFMRTEFAVTFEEAALLAARHAALPPRLTSG
ncbi:hypothetical protein [Hymenobacter psoromatis]|uniref:hypothetical protein n=1 Tax=Hymenobacter psoromatis TaxID=1484116 RepID=UPI001CBAD80F|nr:hypothetical protein [Hymenobacter psoromatis]